MRRGEVWTVAGGVYATKPRPALIIQDDRFDGNESITVCPLTTTLVDAELIRVSVEPTAGNGLKTPNQVQIDKIATVQRSKLGAKVGDLIHSDMIRIERALVVFLGMAG